MGRLASFFSSSRRISIGMGGLRVVRSILSLYTISLSAKYFGVSHERDAWVLGGTSIAIISAFLFGPLLNIFRTKFIHLREEEGEARAIKATSSLVGGIVFISLVIIFVSEVFPELYVDIFAPGFESSQQSLFIQMLRWLLPSLLINQLISLWTALLNSYNSFFIPDIFGFVSSVFNIFFIIYFAPYFGIYALVLSSYISTFLLSVVLVISLKKKNPLLVQVHFSWTAFKPYLFFAFPLYFNYLAGQVLSVVERRLCTYLDSGTVSAFDYAKRFGDLTLNVILSIVPMVLTPILAEHFARRDFNLFGKEYLRYLRMFLIGVIPVVVCFTICSDDVVALLFSRGSIPEKFQTITSSTLYWMGIGVIGIVTYVISGEAWVAQKRVKHITILSSVAYLCISIIDFLFYKRLGAPLLAASWAVVHLILGLLLGYLNTGAISKKTYVKEIGMISIFYIACNIVCYSFVAILRFCFPVITLGSSLSSILGACLLSCIIIGILIFVFKMEERNFIKGAFINRKI